MLEVDGYVYETNTACISCRHVIGDGVDVALLSHDEEDGTLHFLCGGSNHEMSEFMLVSFDSVMKRFSEDYFPSALKPGVSMRRVQGSWVLEQ